MYGSARYQLDLNAPIYEGHKTLIYRGRDESNNAPIIAKVPRRSALGNRDAARLRREFEIVSSIADCDGIVRPLALTELDGIPAIIFEDLGGVSLNHAPKPVSVPEFLDIGLSLVEALNQVHRHGIIHKDIKPANIIHDRERGLVQLIDFGIASRFSGESPVIVSPNRLEGTLQYISPEQTGRMNRTVDFRTDFYSLGITFYELLTGRVPFDHTNDPMELIHAHIARQPPTPLRFREDLPEVLAWITLKLLSKNAEDRYQSAAGLSHDLKKFRELSREGNTVVAFEPGARDILREFQLPQKIYGREKAVDRLLTAFTRVANGGCELLLVHGYSGIGKTKLVNEVHRDIAEKRGNFIAGKFDQFGRDVPFSAILQAFQHLVRFILTESESIARQWKEKLRAALGANGQVIIDVIPEVEHLIGSQPAVQELSPVESRNRFNEVLRDFVRACASADYPLTIFVDDLQWADIPSFEFLRAVMTDPEIKHLLLIGAYRDNEVDATHPLTNVIKEIRKANGTVKAIGLGPLEPDHLRELIKDAFNRDAASSEALAAIVHRRTGGNPFFVMQFLKTLHEEGHLILEGDGGWSWELDAVRTAGVSDDIVELMSGRLKKLARESREVLKLAACIGDRFNFATLTLVADMPAARVIQGLESLLGRGFILPVGDGYKYLAAAIENETRSEFNGDSAEFKFLHDRVQQAAYALIAEEDRSAIHRTIGLHLLENTPEAGLVDEIFTIVRHLNQARDEFNRREERLRIARLNLTAALRAMKSAAFSSALTYLTIASEMLDDKTWDDEYELTWRIFREKSQCEYSRALHEACHSTLKIALEKSRTEDHKVAIYRIYLNYLFAVNDHLEGIRVVREALKYLGVRLPRRIGKADILFQYAKFRLRMKIKGLNTADLPEQPKIENQHMLNILAIISDGVPSTYIAHPDTMAYISMLMANISLRYGNSIYSAFAYATVSLLNTGVFKNFSLAYELSRISLEINEAYPDLNMKARCHFLFANFSLSWVRPVREYRPLMTIAIHSAVEAGSVNWADYAVNFSRPQHILFNNASLVDIETENLEFLKFLRTNKDRETIANQVFLLDFLAALRGENRDPHDLKYDRREYEEMLNTSSNFLFKTQYHAFRMVRSYLFGDNKQALQSGWESMKIVHEVLGNMLDFVARYYYCLTYLRARGAGNKPGMGKRLFYHINRFLIRRAAKSAPANFASHAELIAAEEARAGDRKELAANLYDRSIELAEQGEFPMNQALACELAAKFHASAGRMKFALLYAKDALEIYRYLRADAKVTELAEAYALSTGISTGNTGASIVPVDSGAGHDSIPVVTTSSSSTGMLDLLTVTKASQAISGEIKQDLLLNRFLEIVMENAGARRSLLILNRNGTLTIECEKAMEGGESGTALPAPLEQSDALPRGIIQYVNRSLNPLVLTDANADPRFSSDPYVRNHHPRSVLCYPILYRNELIGIIYLENNLTTDAFTRERIQVMEILSSQIAISLRNAALYAEQGDMTRAFARFMPIQFLEFLEKRDVREVALGDAVRRNMLVLFSDIRGFTDLSEQMGVQDNFRFLNSYLKRVAPAIENNLGFIDKFIGDAVMALFSSQPEDGLNAALDMLRELSAFNEHRREHGYEPIEIGIGLHQGDVMLGTLGARNRLQTTVIGDTVNLTARVESLTKQYKTPIMLTDSVVKELNSPDDYCLREIDSVRVRGKTQPVGLYELYDLDPPKLKEAKQITAPLFTAAISMYKAGEFDKASRLLSECIQQSPDDHVSIQFFRRCIDLRANPPGDDWTGIIEMN